MNITAVIPAAGMGKRFGGDVKKQFFEVLGHTVLYYTLTALNRACPFKEFILGANPDDFYFLYSQLSKADVKNYQLVQGGGERYETVYNCLKAVSTEYVLIHDAVRPFFTYDTVRSVADAAQETGAAICGLPVRDTLKKISGNGVEKTVNRNEYILSHTPQVFRTALLKKAVENADERGIVITDEAQAMELYGVQVKWVISQPDNIKITYLNDMDMAEGLVRKYFGQ
ncbi:2-C-methyl-D-erythritol 4-phosphate cytidylyltransferase [Seleniivibrio woodruffii]|uniref:2-C-methyl-D-erythritol 4-phosphate cytidylyltransferase n=1 Tax=Seleniivibrio woodruffii TaxID=1078050 RepID=UPI0026EEC7AB|nr:2-C-methyl-D-erythritol 4-phosphate cytidylyltransferase [Seleniivibrio woodruffii]